MHLTAPRDPEHSPARLLVHLFGLRVSEGDRLVRDSDLAEEASLANEGLDGTAHACDRGPLSDP